MDQIALSFARDETLDVEVPSQRTSHASVAAAERLKASGVQGVKLQRLMRAYVAVGVHGLTDSEMEQRACLSRQSICSLRAAAKARGWIVAVGEREGSYQGFQQTVWRVTEAGQKAMP